MSGDAAGRSACATVEWSLSMRVGMIGTGAISHKHAQAYKNIGFQLTVCTDIFEAAGRRFADQYGAEFVARMKKAGKTI